MGSCNKGSNLSSKLSVFSVRNSLLILSISGSVEGVIVAVTSCFRSSLNEGSVVSEVSQYLSKQA
jgi:hypothetical protein